ncbi:TenA family protein [Spirulina subsalsa]|uniref:TenA family protein n=1 Tax=Spirulina subsalsa TaxID=54311 RepID=UPI0003093E91|nr:TenA family protein [Spirulina subsalsa]
MGLSQQLWQLNCYYQQACLNHPFVQGIYEGILPPEKFAFYVGQDAFFLEAFARAYSIAAAKAPDQEGFTQLYHLAGGVLEELKLHQQYASQWGVNLTNIRPSPATRQYTDFLLATAWGNTVGLTTVAMTPCMRLYAYIGQQLAQGGIPDHQYGEWVRTYSSPEFEDLAQTLEGLVNRYAPDTPETQGTYEYALICEERFFQAAFEWNSPDASA